MGKATSKATKLGAALLALDANLAQVTDAHATTTKGCEDCIRMGGQAWVHLNMCRTCGHVGCCDNSPNRHATAHFHESGHPIIQRFEPGEDWGWDYSKDLMLQPFPAALATEERHISEAEGYVRHSAKHRGARGLEIPAVNPKAEYGF